MLVGVIREGGKLCVGVGRALDGLGGYFWYLRVSKEAESWSDPVSWLLVFLDLELYSWILIKVSKDINPY